MKILIWVFLIFVTSAISVIIQSAGVTLGAIPTMILYASLFYTAPKLCQKWDKYKAAKALQQEKEAEVIISNGLSSDSTQDTLKRKLDSGTAPTNQAATSQKKLYCKQCGAELPEGSAFCNKCGTKIEELSICSEPPVYIDSLIDIKREHVGKYVQLIGNYSKSSNETNPLKCKVSYYSRRSSMSVSVELLKPLPEYIVNAPSKDRQLIILRGTLGETASYPQYVLRNSEYQGYWRNEIGEVRCIKSVCGHECDENCPIHLDRLGKAKCDEYDRDAAIELFKRAVFLAPDFSDAWCDLGYAYLEAQKHSEAYEAFSESEKHNAGSERTMYGEIVALSKVGRQKEAQDLFEKYKRLFPNKNPATLSNIIGRNLSNLQAVPQISDSEYAKLLTEKGFDEFWKTLVAEKERTFATQPCKYTGAAYRIRCNRLEQFISIEIGFDKTRWLHFRKTLIEDNIEDAESMLLFDVIDEYERRYMIY